jgi:hypothetical protein
MSWKDLAKLIDEASNVGVFGVDLSGHETELKPVLASAEQTSDGGERTESLDGGWQLRYTIDAGGGSACITGEELDGYEVEVDAETVMALVKERGFDASTLTWDDLGASLPDPSELSVMPDDGAVPSLDEFSLVLVAPDGTEYVDGDDCNGEPVTIEVDDAEFNGSGVLTFTVTINVPGVADAPNGAVAVEAELDCSICASYEVEPPDADALDSLADEAMEAVQAEIDAAEEAMDNDMDEDDEDEDSDDDSEEDDDED